MHDEEERNRSQKPRGLRRGSAAVRLLGLRVRILLEAWISVVSVLYYQVEVSATSRSFVQRSPTKNVCLCVIDCDQVQQ